MKRIRFILAVVLAIAVVAVAFQAYSLSSRAQVATISFSPSSNPNYPNPVNQNVTIAGALTAETVAPTCALNNPPCAMVAGSLYYITVNGVNYRLIFPASMKLPLPGAQILVTGVYVTPSAYQATQWTPQVSFRGDIYVIKYSYVFPAAYAVFPYF